MISNHSSNKLEHIRRTIYDHIQSCVSYKVFYIWDFINFTPSTNCFSVSSLVSLSLVSVLESSSWLLRTRRNCGVLQKLMFGKLLSTFQYLFKGTSLFHQHNCISTESFLFTILINFFSKATLWLTTIKMYCLPIKPCWQIGKVLLTQYRKENELPHTKTVSVSLNLTPHISDNRYE